MEEKLFRPDIVVHRRGVDTKNTIVIEIKKDKPCPFDVAKLVSLTRSRGQGGQYEYSLGAFVYFPDGVASYQWFVDGV